MATTIAAIGAVAMLPSAASARSIEPIDPGPLAEWQLRGEVKDRVLPRRPKAFRASGKVEKIKTPKGIAIEVDMSPLYPPTPANLAAAQSYVNLLDEHLHGAELADLTMHILTPAEISETCSPDALACYSTDRHMYIAGEETPGQVPVAYVLTHEYGHHVANMRSNDPWPAVDWGPKHWASNEFVCAGVGHGQLFPGNQAEHYAEDPGEGFAEAYAQYHYRTGAWDYTELLEPDESSFKAVVRDVNEPWTGPKVITRSGKLGRGKQARTLRVPLYLDGSIAIELQGPAGSNYDIDLFEGGQRIAGTRAAGSKDLLQGVWCDEPALEGPTVLKVKRKGGGGPFKVTIAYPG